MRRIPRDWRECVQRFEGKVVFRLLKLHDICIHTDWLAGLLLGLLVGAAIHYCGVLLEDVTLDGLTSGFKDGLFQFVLESKLTSVLTGGGLVGMVCGMEGWHVGGLDCAIEGVLLGMSYGVIVSGTVGVVVGAVEQKLSGVLLGVTMLTVHFMGGLEGFVHFGLQGGVVLDAFTDVLVLVKMIPAHKDSPALIWPSLLLGAWHRSKSLPPTNAAAAQASMHTSWALASGLVCGHVSYALVSYFMAT